MTQQEPAALVHAAPDTSARTVLTPSLGSSPHSSCIPPTFTHSLPSDQALGNSSQIVDREALSHALGAVRALTETLLSPIRNETRLVETATDLTSEGMRQLVQLPQILHGWRLPSIPLDPLTRPLSLDDSLLRYEIAWIHLSCVKSSATLLRDEVADTAKRFEEMLDQAFSIRAFSIRESSKSPFTGLIQAIEIARVTGQISDTESDAAIRAAFASKSRDDAWRILRVTVQHIAAVCDFPRCESSTRAA